MNDNKIFLANLDGVSDIEMETLGTLLVSKFQIAAMSQKRLNDREDPYYLYIDEVQNFSTTSLPKMFSEARKYGLSLTVANQFLNQLEGDTLEAIMGNVGMNITFQVGPPDATKLAAYMQPNFSKDDLIHQSNYKAIIKTNVNDESIAAFSLETDKPLAQSADAVEQIERIRLHTREEYSRPRTEVEQIILDHIKGNSMLEVDDETDVVPDPEDGEYNG